VAGQPPLSGFRSGSWAKVVATGDDHAGRVGKIAETHDDDQGGYDIWLEFKGDPQLYAFRLDELTAAKNPLARKRTKAPADTARTRKSTTSVRVVADTEARSHSGLGGEAAPWKSRSQSHSVALALIALGAMILVISTFLPLYEASTAFSGIQRNTLIQHGGWLLIAAAFAIAAGGLYAGTGKVSWGLPLGLSIMTAFGLFGFAASDEQRTLYPVGADGTTDYSQLGVVVPLGVAMYVAGVGVALAIVGSVILRRTRTHP
jgi:hypothetical protein